MNQLSGPARVRPHARAASRRQTMKSGKSCYSGNSKNVSFFVCVPRRANDDSFGSIVLFQSIVIWCKQLMSLEWMDPIHSDANQIITPGALVHGHSKRNTLWVHYLFLKISNFWLCLAVCNGLPFLDSSSALRRTDALSGVWPREFGRSKFSCRPNYGNWCTMWREGYSLQREPLKLDSSTSCG